MNSSTRSHVHIDAHIWMKLNAALKEKRCVTMRVDIFKTLLYFFFNYM